MTATTAACDSSGEFNRGAKARLPSRFYIVPTFFMNEKVPTIGLTELISEIEDDLKQLRAKNPSDHGIKGIQQFWTLESSLLLVRHSPQTVVKKMRKAHAFKWMKWFFVGMLVMLTVDTGIRLLVR